MSARLLFSPCPSRDPAVPLGGVLHHQTRCAVWQTEAAIELSRSLLLPDQSEHDVDNAVQDSGPLPGCQRVAPP